MRYSRQIICSALLLIGTCSFSTAHSVAQKPGTPTPNNAAATTATPPTTTPTAPAPTAPTTGTGGAAPIMPRKAFYHRPSLTYPGGYVAWSRSLGCDSAILHSWAPNFAELVTQARATTPPMKVFVWSGPEKWRPDTWVATMTRMEGQVTTHRLDGLIADVEDWVSPHNDFRPWQQATAAEKQNLAQRLSTLANTVSVGFTSFPAHAMARQIGQSSRRMWGTPQLYGLRSTTIAQLHNLKRQWAEWFAYVVPSLAAWDRTAAEERTYLQNFNSEPGALFWAFVPSGELFNVLRDWNPAGTSASGPAPTAPGATPPSTTPTQHQNTSPSSRAQTTAPSGTALQPTADVGKDPRVATTAGKPTL